MLIARAQAILQTNRKEENHLENGNRTQEQDSVQEIQQEQNLLRLETGYGQHASHTLNSKFIARAHAVEVNRLLQEFEEFKAKSGFNLMSLKMQVEAELEACEELAGERARR
jgi:hypothetical protein